MPIINTQIKGGVQPTGTKQITSNGVHDVAGYANADVQVPTTAPAHYIEKTVDANGVLIAGGTSVIDMTGVSNLSNYALCYAYYNATLTNTAADFSSLTSVTGVSAFYQAFNGSNIVSVDLSNLETVNADNAFTEAFRDSALESINLSKLKTIGGNNTFYGAFHGTKITTINLNSFETHLSSASMARMFGSCYYLQTVYMNSFSPLYIMGSNNYRVFATCYVLSDIYFGGMTSATFSSKVTQLQYLFNEYTGRDAPNGCTIHFPANFDPNNPDKTFDITTLTGYPTFGGNASYIHLAYDLPATE